MPQAETLFSSPGVDRGVISKAAAAVGMNRAHDYIRAALHLCSLPATNGKIYTVEDLEWTDDVCSHYS